VWVYAHLCFFFSKCVCVCVCLREREREEKKGKKRNTRGVGLTVQSTNLTSQQPPPRKLDSMFASLYSYRIPRFGSSFLYRQPAISPYGIVRFGASSGGGIVDPGTLRRAATFMRTVGDLLKP